MESSIKVMLNTRQVQIYNPSNCDGVDKVVQLELKDKPYLLIGEALHCYILKSFLEEKKIDFQLVQSCGSSALIPAPKGKEYKVVGMGKGNLYFADKLYTGMHGLSRDYGMGIDREHEVLLKKMLRDDGWRCT